MIKRRFKEASIRSQIVTLSLMPVICVTILGIVTQPFFPEESALSRAEVLAAQIALVAGQVEGAGTPELADQVLATTRRSGFEVHWTSPFIYERTEDSAFQRRVLYALSNVHGRHALAVTQDGEDLLFVLDLEGGLLAFAPFSHSVSATANLNEVENDDIVNIVLFALFVVIPVGLLSVYAARLLTTPLTRIAAAARLHNPSDPTGGVFDESGPLEIRQLARRLNEMQRHIRAMLADRTAMLRAVSHDLRTPLTRLKLRVERSVPAETAEILMRDITAVNDMIDETLDYLRSDSETEAPRKTDLPSLLRTICSDFSDVGFSVSYLGPDRLSFTCRPRAMARAVSNLVDNATKFGKVVTVTLAGLPAAVPSPMPPRRLATSPAADRSHWPGGAPNASPLRFGRSLVWPGSATWSSSARSARWEAVGPSTPMSWANSTRYRALRCRHHWCSRPQARLRAPAKRVVWRASARSGSDLAVACHDVLRGCHLGQPHRAAGVELLGRDTDLRAEAELSSVGEARRRIDHDCGSIDSCGEPARGILRTRHDRLGVAGPEAPDVRDGSIE
jgi:signal transduction histidine kinase